MTMIYRSGVLILILQYHTVYRITIRIFDLIDFSEVLYVVRQLPVCRNVVLYSTVVAGSSVLWEITKIISEKMLVKFLK